MTISNKVSIALIAGFLSFSYLIGMDLQTFLWHWAMFLIILVSGFTLFALNIIGGGDAKMAAATGLWLGWSHSFSFLLLSAIFGGLLTILLLKFRSELLPERLLKVEWIMRLHDTKTGVPYGIALGLAALLVYPQTPWMEHVMKMATGS